MRLLGGFMKKLLLVSLMLSMNVFASESKLPTAKSVNVQEYVGKWYAVLALPQFFTRNCVAQTAEYAVINASTISVLNTCFKKNGSETTINGQAVVSNPATNAELVVTFDNFWTKLFKVKGDYIIVKLEADYSTALVASNDRKSLWLLSRTPYVNQTTKEEYVNYAKSLGFDVSKLVESKF
jgi:apolipoprotein D and lipocalin family protein